MPSPRWRRLLDAIPRRILALLASRFSKSQAVLLLLGLKQAEQNLLNASRLQHNRSPVFVCGFWPQGPDRGFRYSSPAPVVSRVVPAFLYPSRRAGNVNRATRHFSLAHTRVPLGAGSPRQSAAQTAATQSAASRDSRRTEPKSQECPPDSQLRCRYRQDT